MVRRRGRAKPIGMMVFDLSRPRRHDDDAVAQEYGLGNRMGDEQNRHLEFLPEAEQIEIHLIARKRVERAERLVHQQEGRIVQQGAADRDALPHAARQLMRILRLESGKADHIQQLPGPRFRYRVPGPANVGLQQDVLQHAAPIKKDVLLKHDAKLGIGPDDPASADRDRAGRRRRQAARDHRGGWICHSRSARSPTRTRAPRPRNSPCPAPGSVRSGSRIASIAHRRR